MKSFFGWVVWIALFIALFAGMDQFFLRTSTDAPGLSEVREFYLDFRRRLVGMVGGGHDEVAAVIESSKPPLRQKDPLLTPRSPRYIYVDGGGQLHFADTYEDVPPPFREGAQPLAENDETL